MPGPSWKLGAELISSDTIAFYELIKNAFDAGSRSGAEIRLEIAIRRNDYLKYRRRAIDGSADIDRLKTDVEKALDPSAPPDSSRSLPDDNSTELVT